MRRFCIEARTVALAFYAVIDANGTPIAAFPGLTRNRDEFLDFLKKAQQEDLAARAGDSR